MNKSIDIYTGLYGAQAWQLLQNFMFHIAYAGKSSKESNMAANSCVYMSETNEIVLRTSKQFRLFKECNTHKDIIKVFRDTLYNDIVGSMPVYNRLPNDSNMKISFLCGLGGLSFLYDNSFFVNDEFRLHSRPLPNFLVTVADVKYVLALLDGDVNNNLYRLETVKRFTSDKRNFIQAEMVKCLQEEYTNIYNRYQKDIDNRSLSNNNSEASKELRNIINTYKQDNANIIAGIIQRRDDELRNITETINTILTNNQ